MRCAYLLIPVLLYLIVGQSFAQRPCAARKFNQDSVVCVCNTTYCDDLVAINVVPQSGKGAQFLSSRDGARFNRTDINTMNSVPANAVILSIDSSVKYQKMQGFGGAFTDAAGINLNSLPAALADNVIKQYYSYPDGIGYTFGRIPMASCDFSTHPYSYDDVDQDFNLDNFALTTEDFTLKIPYLLKAQNYSKGNLKTFGSPWSAPAWMKETGIMKGGGPLKGDFLGIYYQTWAQYFVRFLQEYAKQGVKLWGVTLQNEPNTGKYLDFPWQTMYWNASMERDFVKQMLGDALRNYDSNLNLMVLDDNRGNLPAWADIILADSTVAQYVKGIGVHWYEDETAPPSNLNDTHFRHPDHWMLYTEACVGWGDGQQYPMLGYWSKAEQYADDIIQAINNWVTGWNDWNIALDMNGGPNWVGNVVESPIIVNANSSEYYKQPTWYAMGHFSRFVRPNAYRIKSSLANGNIKDLEYSAFQNEDNTRTLIVLNKNPTDTYHLAVTDLTRPQDKYYVIDVPPKSLTSLVI